MRKSWDKPRPAALRLRRRPEPAHGRPADLAAGAARTALRDRFLRRRVRAHRALACGRCHPGGASNVSARIAGEAVARRIRQRVADDCESNSVGSGARLRVRPGTDRRAVPAADRGATASRGLVRTCARVAFRRQQRGGLFRSRAGRSQHPGYPRKTVRELERQLGEHREDAGRRARVDSRASCSRAPACGVWS